MADEVKGWLYHLDGSNYFVEPGIEKLQKHPPGQGPNPNWSGWEAVKLTAPDDQGRRQVVFDEAQLKLSEDNDGRLTVKGMGWNGDFEMFIIAEQPKDWKVALVFRRHGDTIKAVSIFRRV